LIEPPAVIEPLCRRQSVDLFARQANALNVIKPSPYVRGTALDVRRRPITHGLLRGVMMSLSRGPGSAP
jgi:hypothetical protein